LDVVPLLVQRGERTFLTPADDFPLAPDDEILLAGRSAERRGLETTIFDDAVCAYVLRDQHLPSSWIWRRLSSAGQRTDSSIGDGR
jgi:hypothetical protein